MGIAGMILGILAIIFVWIPFIGLIAIPMVAIGLPLSIIGFRNARRQDTGAGMAIAGMVTNIVAMAVILLWMLIFGAVFLGTATTGPFIYNLF